MPRSVRKRGRIGPAGIEPRAGARNRKNTRQINFKNPRSSIRPESAPDPKCVCENYIDIKELPPL